MDAKLKFWNHSDARRPPNILIFQNDGGRDSSIRSTAWKVIKGCGRDCYHPITYTFDMEITVNDGDGNYSPHLNAEPGHSFSVTSLHRGRRLFQQGVAHRVSEIHLNNDLNRGALDCHIFRSGRAVTSKYSVAPGQQAVFTPSNKIWIGVTPTLPPGHRLNTDAIPLIKTELSLDGIASADIVMHGGELCTDSTSFKFCMENIIPW
ncbi:MAG: hypothetical protein L3J28_10795 [Candidatus Polarisedimenticolaceae bacterium]|nr:hypothetical protein [Candidatus Polarisedimenticolaceae bacterium]